MVKIRLNRTGRKKLPSYRIVATDSNVKRDGAYLENIGYYNPSEDDKKIVYDKEKYEKWIKLGAQPTEAVVKLIEGKYEYIKYPKPKEVIEKVENAS